MPENAVLYAPGRVGVLTLNRPDNRNSMTPDLLGGFASGIAQAKRDTDLRCLVITGSGSCFSAGADLKSNVQSDDGPNRLTHERSYAMYEPFLSTLDVEVPTIAALNGHAVGGGFGLALVCDLRIACDSAKYGANFTRLGFHPGMAITYLLPRLIGVARAAELLFSGRLITGTEAASYGIANEALPANEVFPRALAIAELIAENSPLAVRMTKRSLYRGLDWEPRKAAFEEAYAQAISLETEDAKEGMAALLEKRAPNFRGC